MTATDVRRDHTRIVRATDQVVNSASSAVFGVGSVLLLDPAGLGLVAVQMVVMAVGLGVVRTSIFEAALFGRSDGADRDPSAFASLMPRSGMVGGAAVGVVMAAVGAAIDGRLSSVVLVTAIVGVVTLAVDGVRYAAFAADRPTLALGLDAAWLCGTPVLAVMISALASTSGYVALAGGYAAAGVVAALAASPRAARVLADLPRRRVADLGAQRWFGADFLLQVGPGQLVLVVAPLLIGLDGLGLYRAVVTIFQPLLTAATAARLAIVGGTESSESLRRSLTRLRVALVGSVVVYTVAVWVLVIGWGVLDRGALVDATTGLLFTYAVAELFRVGMQPSFDIVRLDGSVMPLLRLRVAQAITLIVGSIVGGALVGVIGYAMARLVTAAIAVPWIGTGSVRDVEP